MKKDDDQDITTGIGEIKDKTLPEIHIRMQAELACRERLAKVRRVKESLEDPKELAEFETKQSKLFFEECKNILINNLNTGVNYDWASLYNDKPFPPFVYKEPAPRYNKIAKEAGVPQKKFLSELFLPSVKNARLQKENDAGAAYDQKLKSYEAAKEEMRTAHEKERGAYLAEQSAYNSRVEELQLDFEKGVPTAVQSFARIVLNGIKMPDSINIYFEAAYLAEEKQLVIDCLLPSYFDLPRAVSYQYNKEDGAVVSNEMSEQEFDEFYLGLIQQITLAAINTVFNAMPARHARWVGFNGWAENDKIGDTLESKSCVITCSAARDVFTALDLLKFSPADCIHELKGLTAKSLSGTDGVQPVIITGPLTGTGDANQADEPKPPEYKPGEFKQVTTKLVGEMLEQIEKNLVDAIKNKNDVIH